MKRQHFLLSYLKTLSVGPAQPRPQGAFPWLWRWGAFKAREKRPGDEVGPGWDLNPLPPAHDQKTDALPNELTMLWFSNSYFFPFRTETLTLVGSETVKK